MVRARAAVAVTRRGARPAATGLHRRRRRQPGATRRDARGAARAGGPAANIAIHARNISWRRRPSGRSSSRWCGRAPVTDPRSTMRRRPTTPRCPTIPRGPTMLCGPTIRHPATTSPAESPATDWRGRPVPADGPASDAASPSSASWTEAGVAGQGPTRAEAGMARPRPECSRGPSARGPRPEWRDRGPKPEGARGPKPEWRDRGQCARAQARVARPRPERARAQAGMARPWPRARVGPSPSGATAARAAAAPSPNGGTVARSQRVRADRSRNGATVAPPRVGPSPSGATGPGCARPQAGMAGP